MRDDEIIAMAVRKAIDTMKPVDILLADNIIVRCTPRRTKPVFKGHIPRMVIMDELERVDPEVKAVIAGDIEDIEDEADNPHYFR